VHGLGQYNTFNSIKVQYYYWCFIILPTVIVGYCVSSDTWLSDTKYMGTAYLISAYPGCSGKGQLRFLCVSFARRLVVRILPPVNDKCIVPLGMKFGCHPKQVPHLLDVAKELELDVVGVR